MRFDHQPHLTARSSGTLLPASLPCKRQAFTRHIIVPQSSCIDSTVASKIFSNPASCATVSWRAQHLMPCAMMRPSPITSTRSPRAITSSRLCVTDRMGMRVRLIPPPQIVEDLRLGCLVQSGQRFVEQEDAWIGHQALAGDFPSNIGLVHLGPWWKRRFTIGSGVRHKGRAKPSPSLAA